MLTLEDVFSEQNLALAMENLLSKRDSCGIDGVYISQFKDYWALNRSNIIKSIYQGEYIPNMVQSVEIVSYKRKKRTISKFATIDRFLLRAIVQVLQPECEAVFSDYCFSYRDGYGVLRAVQNAAEYIEHGNHWVAELDISHYFDNIPLKNMEQKLARILNGTGALYQLIVKFFHCKIEQSGKIHSCSQGLIQGSPLSPMLSNLYLTELDCLLERNNLCFIRFGDDLNIYTKTPENAAEAFALVENYLLTQGLSLNKKKSGVFSANNRTFLGYEFQQNKKAKTIFVQKQRIETKHYPQWKKSAIEKIDRNYHIINDGILTKQDYTLLFENESGKKYLPVETMDSLSIYGDIIFTSNFFQFANQRRLRVSLFDKYGNFIGNFTGADQRPIAKTMLKQSAIYLDANQRLAIAKSLIMAAMHNIRSNVKYYYKQTHSANLQKTIEQLSTIIKQMNEAFSIEQLMMIEARGRQIYYAAFNDIINDADFLFSQRTKRPPKDAINALISFGNVFLYNRISTEIRKTSLDIRVGFLHSTNNRAESLNLDLAELFKPIIVDRAIFTLINKNQITTKDFFEETDQGGVYLNKNGKRLFVETLETKMYQKVKIKNETLSYQALIRAEIQKILRLVLYGEKYKPYKYIV